MYARALLDARRLGVSVNLVRKSSEATSYCIDLVRRYDYENYLCTLLLPESVRGSVFAIRAFNVEVSRVRDNVSETAALAGRLQFWSDVVERAFDTQNGAVGSPLQQPTALALRQAVRSHRISKGWLKRLVTARRSCVSSTPFTSVRSMEEHAVNAFTPVHYMVLQCLDTGSGGASGGSVMPEHLRVLSRLGRSQGVTALLRATPPLLARGTQLPLPLDVLDKHGIRPHDVTRGGHVASQLCHVAFDVASAAQRHLQHVRDNFDDIPRHLRVAFLPAVCVARYLRRLQRADFNLFDARVQARDGLLPLALYWHRLRRTI